MSVIYLKYLAPFLPFLAIGLSITTGFRSIGDVKTPLIISLIMNVIGVSFMVVLTHGYLGFNNYGVYGAAIGNGISFICGAVLSMIVWRMNLVKAKYSSLFVLDVKRIKKIFEVGFPFSARASNISIGYKCFFNYCCSVWNNRLRSLRGRDTNSSILFCYWFWFLYGRSKSCRATYGCWR